MSRLLPVAVALSALLAACAAPEPASDPAAQSPDERATVRVLSGAAVYRGSATPERERLIADTLYAALQALDEDRLLTPVDDNAHGRFRRVLAMDPDNELALQGLQDIVLRYVELAEEATYQGLFDEAEVYLQRASFVDENHTAIAQARAAIERERNSGDLFFDLEASAVVNRRDTVVNRLTDIARQARQHEAFFLITAPNDNHARWIYSVMREAVPGYRLRGNIEMASRYSIRLRMPEDEGSRS